MTVKNSCDIFFLCAEMVEMHIYGGDLGYLHFITENNVAVVSFSLSKPCLTVYTIYITGCGKQIWRLQGKMTDICDQQKENKQIEI